MLSRIGATAAVQTIIPTMAAQISGRGASRSLIPQEPAANAATMSATVIGHQGQRHGSRRVLRGMGPPCHGRGSGGIPRPGYTASLARGATRGQLRGQSAYRREAQRSAAMTEERDCEPDTRSNETARQKLGLPGL